MLCVSDCIADRVSSIIHEPTEWQRVGDENDAARIFLRGETSLLLTLTATANVSLFVRMRS